MFSNEDIIHHFLSWGPVISYKRTSDRGTKVELEFTARNKKFQDIISEKKICCGHLFLLFLYKQTLFI